MTAGGCLGDNQWGRALSQIPELQTLPGKWMRGPRKVARCHQHPRLWSPSASVGVVEMACSWRGNPRSQPQGKSSYPPFFVLKKKKRERERCFPGLRKIAGHPYTAAEEKYLNENPCTPISHSPPPPQQGRPLVNKCWWCELLGQVSSYRSGSQGQRKKRTQDPELTFQQLPGLL